MRKLIPLLLLLMSLCAVSARAETAEQAIEQADQLRKQAAELYQQGKNQESIALLQQSLVIREKILGSEHAEIAMGINNLAVLYEFFGQYDQALPLYRRVLVIREKSLGSDHIDTAFSLNRLGRLYLQLGQYDQALPLFQRALLIREKALGPDQVSTAESLRNLAELYKRLGQYDKAMPLIQRTLDICEKVLGPDHPYTALSLNHLASMYGTLGQYDKALPLYQRALVIQEKILSPDDIETAASLNNLASLYETYGQYDKALPLLQRALAIHENVLGSYHVNTAISLYNLGWLYIELGQYEQAMPLLQRALAIHENVLGPYHVNTAISLDNLGGLYQILGQYEQALLLYQRAFQSSLAARVPDILKSVQRSLGSFYAKQNNPATAIFYLKGAVNTMQSIRTESRELDKSLQKSLLKKNEDVYKELAALLVDSGRLAEAQQVLSMLKEDEYFDFIRRDANADTRGTRMNYSDTEKTFAKRLEKLGNDGAELADKLNALNKQAKLGLTPEQEKQRARIKAQLAEQTKQTIALLNDIAQQLPTAKKQQLTEAGRENQEQLRATLTSLGHGAVLLQYLITDTRVHIILTTPQALLTREAKIPATELYRKIIAFQLALQNPARDPRPLAQEMYQLLIAPVENDLKQANAQTLMFSLDGNLRYLPMSALHDGETYLIERYPLAMYTEVAKNKLREKPVAQWKIAGLGTTRKVGSFDPLPAVRQELNGIIHTGFWKAMGGVFPGDIYLDEDFTQERLHDVLDRAYPVVHIASHYVTARGMEEGTELNSYLLLGDGTELKLKDLRTSEWNFSSVDMMALSACETAPSGDYRNGREIESLGALIQRQGAKGVLATLWKVADRSTAILMQSLYRLRQEKGLTKAEALREAQLTLISDKHTRPVASSKTPFASNAEAGTTDAYTPDPARPYAHPYYWAPFILMGNWL